MPRFEDDFFTEQQKFKPKKYRAWLEQPHNKLESNQTQNEVKLESNQTQNEVKLESNQTQNEVKLESNQTQNEVKLESNQTQNEVKLESNQTQNEVKLESNQTQNEVKLESNQTQNEVKLESNQTQNEVKLESNQTQNEVKLESNQTQNEVKLESKSRVITSLSPLSKMIIEYIYKKTEVQNKRETIELKVSDIAKSCHTTVSGSKITITRLIRASLLERTQYKAGKYGWSRYKLPYEVFKILQEQNKTSSSLYNSNTTMIDKYKGDSVQNLASPELVANLQKEIESLKMTLANGGASATTPTPTPTTSESATYSNQFGSNMGTNVGTKYTESGNNLGTEPTQQNLEDWDNIDFSALEPFKFQKAHIKQIRNYKTDLTPQQVQDSIEHYAWALNNRIEELEKKYDARFANNNLCVLLGTLKRGNQWIEANYKSQEDIAIEEQTNAAKKRLERINKQKEEALETNYQLWRAEMSDEEYKQMRAALPPICQGQKDDNRIVQNAIKNYFKENIHNKGER